MDAQVELHFPVPPLIEWCVRQVPAGTVPGRFGVQT